MRRLLSQGVPPSPARDYPAQWNLVFDFRLARATKPKRGETSKPKRAR